MKSENKNAAAIMARIDKLKTELFYMDMIDYQTRHDKEIIKQLENEKKQLEAQL